MASWTEVLGEASAKGLEVECLPSKMVFTRKPPVGRQEHASAGTTAPSRARRCIADGCLVRAMIRTAGLQGWMIGGTDVRTGFLNAPIRDLKKLVVMEAPSVFTKMNLMEKGEVLVVRKAMYGLVTSLRILDL